MNIENIILDVDGTLTDGKITYDTSGKEYKSFSVKDGLIINTLVKKEKNVIILTGRESSIVTRRFQELGVKEIYQGIKEKKKFILKKNINLNNTLYIGDDVNDYELMKLCNFKACPKDATKEIIEISEFVSSKKGGDGAVREILEHYFPGYIKEGYNLDQ